MIPIIDKYIEKKLKKMLHSRRSKIIHNTIKTYSQTHALNTDQINELEEKLNTEADRVYAIVDKSILRERVSRARYTFWISIIASTVIVGVLGGFSAGAVIPFIIPILTALVTWIVSLGTVPISYNQRILGSMDSIVSQFDKLLQNPVTLEKNNNFANSKENEEIKNSLKLMYKKIKYLANRIDIVAKQTNTVLPDIQVNQTNLLENDANESESKNDILKVLSM